MTRRDYELIARTIRQVSERGGDRGTLLQLVTSLREPLQADNHNFNFTLFAHASGFEGVE